MTEQELRRDLFDVQYDIISNKSERAMDPEWSSFRREGGFKCEAGD